MKNRGYQIRTLFLMVLTSRFASFLLDRKWTSRTFFNVYHSKPGYYNDFLSSFIFRKTCLYCVKKSAQSRNLDGRNIELASILSSLRDRDLKVLDFGGGSGYHYFQMEDFFRSRKDFVWLVVETAAMVKASVRIAGRKLQFTGDLDQAMKIMDKPNLVLASSSLQYSKNPKDVLKRLALFDSDYILFTKTPLLRFGDSISSIHVSRLSLNGPGIGSLEFKDQLVCNEITFLAFNELHNVIVEANYELEKKLIDSDKFFWKGRVVPTYTLLYRKLKY